MDRGKVRKMIIPEEEEKKRLGLKSKCFSNEGRSGKSIWI